MSCGLAHHWVIDPPHDGLSFLSGACKLCGAVRHDFPASGDLQGALVPRTVDTPNKTSMAKRNAAKTHCANGHEFSPDNTYWHGSSRQCRACKVAANHRAGLRRGPEGQTHCPKGHEYTAENTVKMGGRKRCRTCNQNFKVRGKAPTLVPAGEKVQVYPRRGGLS